MTSIPLYQRLWAKTDRKTGATHPLLCHLLDVATVAQVLWEDVLTAGIRNQLIAALKVDPEAAGRVIVFWAGCHDLGKATPAFQQKYLPAKAELQEAGLTFIPERVKQPFYHGAASACLLPELLESTMRLSGRAARTVAFVVGGHHGAWPAPEEIQDLEAQTDRLGQDDWHAVRVEMIKALADCVNPPLLEQAPGFDETGNAFWSLVSGFTSVADWIGSMETYFPYAQAPVDAISYIEQTTQQAHHALSELGWMSWAPPATKYTFNELFAIEQPRPMQARTIELAEHLSQPALVIIEAPTGVGKTEAALYLADHWGQVLQQRGTYVAMPTMATSNQMYGRVAQALERRYPQQDVKPLLVHSQAQWLHKGGPPDMTIVEQDPEDASATVDAMSWFLPRKRSLLAPFAVGTVDQALLGVLQTRHFFVRLFGLSHKTVIFDEVHAYDTYMSALFQRLLGWLHAVGTSVVLLSATLPARTRRELLQAYAGEEINTPESTYPAITWAMEGQTGVVPLSAPEGHTFNVGWLSREPTAIAEALKERLQEGGCAAVICNTVGRAQTVFRELQKADLVPPEDLILFHAHFPFMWRDEIEKAVLQRFGKGERPAKAIVVATQVIEQSLDLDFDVMISDLAPIDLLIQRAGRLHRHQRETRPAPLQEPKLWIAEPLLDNGTPHFNKRRDVYEPYVLLRTYLTLQRHGNRIRIPDDTAPLIEAVYGEDAITEEPWASRLREAHQAMTERQDEAIDKARKKLVASPHTANLLRKNNQGLSEDNPDLHAAFQALTRLGPPSISLVCLHRVNGALNTQPDGQGRIVTLDDKPDADLTRMLVLSAVTMTSWDVVADFQNEKSPPGWREHSLLKHYRAAIFEEGLCPRPDFRYTLRLTREYGLEVLRKES